MCEVRWYVSLKRQFPWKRRNVTLYFSFWVGGTLHVHICVETVGVVLLGRIDIISRSPQKTLFSLGTDTMYIKDGVSRIIVVGCFSRGDPPYPVRLLVGIEQFDSNQQYVEDGF